MKLATGHQLAIWVSIRFTASGSDIDAGLIEDFRFQYKPKLQGVNLKYWAISPFVNCLPCDAKSSPQSGCIAVIGIERFRFKNNILFVHET